MKYKLALITYDNRSGSTLLAANLHSFSCISVFPESAFLTRILDYPLEIFSYQNLQKLINYLYKEPQFQAYEIDLKELIDLYRKETFPINKKNVIILLIDYIAQLKNYQTPWIILKSPGIIFYVNKLKKYINNIKIINIIRDGRAVYNSKRKARMINGFVMEYNLLKAAKDWREKLIITQRYSEETIFIKYEELVFNPDSVVIDCLKFLEIDQANCSKEAIFSNYYKNIGENQKHLHENIIKGEMIIDNINKWKYELSQNDIVLYTLLNKKYLNLFNYEVNNYQGKWYSPIIVIKICFFFLHFVVIKIRNLFYYSFIQFTLFEKIRMLIHRKKLTIDKS